MVAKPDRPNAPAWHAGGCPNLREATLSMKPSTKTRAAAKTMLPSSMGRTLEDMGVSPLEECLYRLLLRHEGLGVTELAGKSGTSARSVVKPLQALESKGMVTHSPDRLRRYFAVPPDIAMEALIASSQ